MKRHYKQLTQAERCQIEILKAREESYEAIARQLGRNRSTISREVRRNAFCGEYTWNGAHIISKKRKFRKPKRLNEELKNQVESGLRQQWSPEQISGRLKMFNIHISHETIYQHVWHDKRCGGELYKNLRRSGKKYNKRGSGIAGRGCIPNRVDISERPKIVDEKSRLGDWEIDTIIGGEYDGAIVSIVERNSKLTKLVKVERTYPNKILNAILTDTSEVMYGETICLSVRFSMGDSSEIGQLDSPSSTRSC